MPEPTPNDTRNVMPLNERGHPVGPVLYPRFLRQVADVLDALVAFEQPDPRNHESSHYVGDRQSLPVFDEDAESEDDGGLVGWLHQYDAACWVFVPRVEVGGSADV